MLVQVVSDVVCPWCRIGKKNLETAAVEFTKETGEEVELTFLPYLLDPIQPDEEGESFRERFINRKGMSAEQMDGMFHSVTEAGKQFGVDFHFENVKIAVNTVPAHELMELTPPEKRLPLMDELMKQYFENGANIGDIDTLLKLAEPVIGKEAMTEIAPAMKARVAQPMVMQMIQQVQEAGVRSVPYTIIDSKYAVSGGQSPEVFQGALMQAWEAKKNQPEEAASE